MSRLQAVWIMSVPIDQQIDNMSDDPGDWDRGSSRQRPCARNQMNRKTKRDLVEGDNVRANGSCSELSPPLLCCRQPPTRTVNMDSGAHVLTQNRAYWIVG